MGRAGLDPKGRKGGEILKSGKLNVFLHLADVLVLLPEQMKPFSIFSNFLGES